MELNQSALFQYNQSRDSKVTGKLCHAPFVSMNFDQSGKITACCYNRKEVLGIYPIINLVEAWKGEQAELFREKFTESTIANGCSLCSIQINAGNYGGTRAAGFDRYFKQKKESIFDSVLQKFGKKTIDFPKVLEFEIDNTCNLECVMCSGKYSSLIRKNREKLPPTHNPYNDEFVKQLTPFIENAEEIKFLGGEPFITPIYFKIWDLIAEVNPTVKIVITTNATILTKKVKWLFENLNANIVLSIDSLRKETYEKIRINANFDSVVNNIDYYISKAEKLGRNVSMAACPMTVNWEEIPGLSSFCENKKINIYFNTVVDPFDLSLRYFSITKLSEIAKIFKNNFACLPVISNNNKAAYKGLINQVEGLLNEKKKHLQTVVILSQIISETENNTFGNLYVQFQQNWNVGFERSRQIEPIDSLIDQLLEQFKENESDCFQKLEELITKAHFAISNTTDSKQIIKNFEVLKSFTLNYKTPEKVIKQVFSEPFSRIYGAMNFLSSDELQEVLKNQYIG